MKVENFVPGLRIVKTSLAIFICLVFFDLINYPEPPVYAAIACILTLRYTIVETRHSGTDRMIGTIFGGMMALIVLSLPLDFVYEPLLLAITVMVTLMLCKALRFRPGVFSMAGVILIIILLSHPLSHQEVLTYVSIRVIETLAGIVVAMLVNIAIKVPDPNNENRSPE